MTYAESIEWLFSTQFFGIKLGLEGPRRLLREALAFPPRAVTVIQVAGTNGKGSVCAMIDSVARAAGRRTGLFTSPHLVDFRERIRVAGTEIPATDCARLLTELRSLCERLDPHPTFFEITLACALRHFRERDCELLVLETGMGGRLDATTAVPADVCVITPVDLDHQQWLGNTLAEIAAEKAAIIRPGLPVVCSPQQADARKVIEQVANERRAPLTFVDEPLRGYPVGLEGPHQPWNAALALHALHAAKVPLAYDTVHHGLATVRWPGRFEIVRHSAPDPIHASAPALPSSARPPFLVLDGAHNPHSAEALAATWQAKFPDTPCTLLFSAVDGKDIPGILRHLSPLATRVLICRVDSPRAASPEQLLAALPPPAPPHQTFATARDALHAALREDTPLLVAGSLFLVGEIRALLCQSHRLPSSQ